ncbi:MAG: HhH-GPD family protein [Thermoleophilia bacterium]|nr:HhH-GPD family protein [Thermoleophilia bacterium]
MHAARSHHRTAATASHLWLTDDPEACALLAEEPVALIIGYILDQQITVQKAFRGALDVRERLGTLDAGELASIPLDRWESAFAQKPALHRYPKAMAKRVREAMHVILERYDGDAGRLWWDASDLTDFRTRLEEIPGLRGHKWLSMASVLARRCGVPLTGWEQDVMPYGTLGDVETPADIKQYQARKRAYKQALKTAEADGASPESATLAAARAIDRSAK